MLTRSQVIRMHLKVREACLTLYRLMGIKLSLYVWCGGSRVQMGRRGGRNELMRELENQ